MYDLLTPRTNPPGWPLSGPTRTIRVDGRDVSAVLYRPRVRVEVGGRQMITRPRVYVLSDVLANIPANDLHKYHADITERVTRAMHVVATATSADAIPDYYAAFETPPDMRKSGLRGRTDAWTARNPRGIAMVEKKKRPLLPLPGLYGVLYRPRTDEWGWAAP